MKFQKLFLTFCVAIHKNYGPGLFESVYEELLHYELNKLSISLQRQKAIPLIHEQIKMEIGFRADIIVENKVIIEIKSVEEIAEIHYKQVLTYLKLANLKLEMLINFNVPLIKNGIHRIVNKL